LCYDFGSHKIYNGNTQITHLYRLLRGFLGGSDSKESAYNMVDPGLILGLGRSSKKGMATHFSIVAWRIP
jgi:hypothetical protein